MADFSRSNLDFVEELYQRFLGDALSVPEEWRGIFAEWKREESTRPLAAPSFKSASLFRGAAPTRPEIISSEAESTLGTLKERILQFIRAYRFRGHSIADIDPLGQPRPVPPELNPDYYHFTKEDLEQKFLFETFSPKPLPLGELIEKLRQTYGRSIGVEYMHIDDVSIRRWLQDRMESTGNRLQLTREEQLRILTRLTDAVIFEEFIRKKFIGAKSFSLEGSESLIPMLDLAIEKAAEQDVCEIVFGMAHRGRLNVLANIMGKHPKQIFREFADVEPERYRGSGDVKYHLGHSTEWETASGKKVHLSLSFNPSHLEFVNPIVVGRARGIQDRIHDTGRKRIMAMLIHGDASFAGQGVIQEVLNLSSLKPYTIGGALHIVVNNQIGFTTSPSEARSTTYATDVAKMLQIPIFHVNGEDPEAVAQVIRLAMDFRNTFTKDVVIDMYGYRRLGHNESDEPSFTQPLLYRAIEKHKPVREGYLDHLLALGGITREEADQITTSRREHLEQALADSRHANYRLPDEPSHGVWNKYVGGPEAKVADVATGVAKNHLGQLLESQTRLPEKFHPHPKISKILDARRAMAKGEQPLDWAAAETLAYATLASEGIPVRMSGQDAERGTFSHRHAALHDYENGDIYVPLQHLETANAAENNGSKASVEIYNSPLSEVAVMGFELGISMERPDALVLWEAQFGDFVNVAQVILDQFIVSEEKKWRRYSGLVLLLPHGFEGQGPEHSSARLERFLSLAAEDNIQVVYPTTPAQFFHLLRRQALRPWRKPLIVMSPKSLLRHPKAVSSLDDLATGNFQRVIPDHRKGVTSTSRVLLCSGKIFYELDQRRDEAQRSDVAIVRIEQLYPLADEVLQKALAAYEPGTPLIWVQEEPQNMGAWPYLRLRFGEKLLGKYPLSYVGRPASASPATGSHNSHKLEQSQLVAEAFAEPPRPRGNKKETEYANRIESSFRG